MVKWEVIVQRKENLGGPGERKGREKNEQRMKKKQSFVNKENLGQSYEAWLDPKKQSLVYHIVPKKSIITM